MAKISKEAMHEDETIVLNILEQHAKESIDVIAKKCGFSRQKVWKIIKHLEEKKKIWGYTAITDEEVKEMKHFVLLVKRSSVPFTDVIRKELIHEKLDDYMPGVVKIENIYITHGNYDWIITFYAPNLVTAKNFLAAVSKQVSEFIKEYHLLETLFPVRKQGFKNPQIKRLVEFL